MKALNNWMVYSLLGASLMLGACVDNEKDLSQIDPEKKMTNLNVPSDFSWNMTRALGLEINSPKNSYVSVYTDANCTDASLVATLRLKENEVTKTRIDIPNASKQLYLKYPISEEAVNATPVSVDVPTATPHSRAGEDFMSIVQISTDKLHGMYERSGGRDEDNLNVYACAGTLLFEDNWPKLGDYDFNDLVADYRIETHISLGHADHYQHERIEVSVTIRAIGGYLPDKLGLRFLGKDEGPFSSMRQKFIDRYELEQSAGSKLTVRIANPDRPEENPIFYIEGLRNLKNGEMYYNTEKKAEGELATVNFTLYASLYNKLDANSAFSQAAYVDNQDFFLVTTDGHEIHLRGYEPTPLYTAYEEDLAKADINMGSKTYSTDGNLIWGLKVISQFKYPLEKNDLRKTYGETFTKWVESGGDELYDNWHKYGNPEMVIGW